MFEQYIPQIAFGMTAIICAFLGGIFIRHGRGWTKTIISGGKFASKKQGFIVFIVGATIMAILATWLKSLIESTLYANPNNIFGIVIVFFIACLLYYDRMVWG